MTQTFRRISSLIVSTALGFGLAAAAPAMAQDATPLERHPDRLFNFETANTLPARTLKLWTGWHQTAPGGTLGTGNQVYFGGVDWAVSDRVTLSFGHSQFDDLTPAPIAGATRKFILRSTAGAAKVKLFDRGAWSMAALASVEEFRLSSGFYGAPEPNMEKFVVAAVHLPVTYAASERLQFHVTPSVSVFPDQINGVDFYGTVAALGAGLTWQASPRWTTYGALNMPLSGGNVIKGNGAIGKVAIWTAGARYHFSPKVALDLFATNGMGSTPATAITAFFPDGDTALFGAMINYTPGHRQGWPATYRDLGSTPLTQRQRGLQLDGFTLPSASTLSPGRLLASANGGSDGGWSGKLQFSPDYDGQIELAYEQYANDGSVGPSQLRNFTKRYEVALKLRFMDQASGAPFSLSALAQIGRDSSTFKTGVLYLALPMSYDISPRATLNLVPKGAAWGGVRKYGLGLGANFALNDNLTLIGEVTPVNDGDPVVWAAGLRGHSKSVPLHIDLYATNAVGRTGLGSLVGQSGTRVALTATLDLNLNRR